MWDAWEEGEYALFLSDEVSVSPHAFRYLSSLLSWLRDPAAPIPIYSQEWLARRSLLGVSLLSLLERDNAGVLCDKNAVPLSLIFPFGSSDYGQPQLVAYQLFSERFQLVFPEPWRDFLDYYAKRKQAKSKPPLENVRLPSHWAEDGWQAHLLRFVYTRSLFTLYASLPRGRALASTDSAAVLSGPAPAGLSRLPAALATVPRRDLCGQAARLGRLESTEQGLAQLLEESADPADKTIVVATVNKGFLDFVYNWLCSLRRVGVDRYLLYTVEEDTARRLALEGHPVYFDPVILNEKEKTSDLSFGTVPYQKLTFARTTTIYRILQLKYRVLIADVDAVWLKNPLPYLRENIGDKNLVAQNDGRVYSNRDVICLGFLYMMPTPEMIDIYRKVYEGHKEYIDRAMQAGNEKMKESSQTLLTQLVMNNATFKYGMLPTDLFPNGHNTFVQKKPWQDAYVIHNNYVVGGDNKRTRFKTWGFWYIDDIDLHCRSIDCMPSGALF